MTTPPAFSAVVVTYRTGPLLDACIDACLKAGGETIVVDNGNPQAVLAGLHARADSGGIILLSGHGNIGFGRACNLGAERATGPVLAFVNPDCIPEDGALSALCATARDHNALVGGLLTGADGLEQRGARRGELTLWSALASFSGLARSGEQAGAWRDFNRNREPLPDTLTDLPVVSGAFMALPKLVFDAIGGFDPRFFLHVEDVDLCRRVRENQNRVLFHPGARAVHAGGTSEMPAMRVEMAKAASLRWYFWKHSRGVLSKLNVVLWWPVIAAALLARTALRAMRVKAEM